MQSWENVQKGFGKVRSVTEKITPPVPSDEFEMLKVDVLTKLEKLDDFVEGQVTGGGSLSLPGAEPE
jgi:hypothetical protein